MEPMPDLPAVECCEFYGRQHHSRFGCECSRTERALRAWKEGRCAAPMTPAQRAWCIEEIRSCGDSTIQPSDAEFATMDDRDLATSVMHAWMDYCRDKGLLR